MIDNLEKILKKLENVKGSGTQWTARCPSHQDSHSSLSVSAGANGKVLLKCFAGCGYPEIIEALKNKKALTIKSETNEKTKKSIVATYDYRDEEGKLLFQVVRTYPKGFFQRRTDGRGGWINGLKGIKTVIYNLPNVMRAVSEGNEIFIVEGEKDADRLISNGFVATTSPMGASSYKNEYAEYFIGANVVIIPDNDLPGVNLTKKIANSLTNKAVTVKIVQLPDLDNKGDISDWLDKGNTKEDLVALISKADYYKPENNTEVRQTDRLFPCTDLGNAERLVNMFGTDIRYCFESNSWLIWDGIRWIFDKNGEIERRAKLVVRSIYAEAARRETKDERQELSKWALESESKRAIKAMVDLAKSESGMPISREQLDSNDWVINCLNGTINLRTGELMKHKREEFLTLLAPVLYDKNARSEVFDKFLKRILPDDELRQFVQVASGYSMSGDTSEEKLFFAYGPPASGKSTLFSAIKAVLGDYAVSTDFETFLERKSTGAPRNDIARLAGKRFVLGSEIDEGKKLAESLVKQITGNDTITARFLHNEFFEFKPKMKLWLAANFRPRVSANDEAMWRRILQAPFSVSIPKEERDPKIKQVLSDTKLAGPAVLSWLVEGCLKWQKNGLIVPKIVEDFTNEYKDEMDPLKEFFSDSCIINPLAKVTNTNLWDEYETWCKENGEKYPLGRKKFTQRLEANGFAQERTSTARCWKGLGLKDKKFVTDMTHYDIRNNKNTKENLYMRDNTKCVSQPSQDRIDIKFIKEAF